MAKLTINPEDVTELKTPLYKYDEKENIIYLLRPETTADQVKYAGGQNGEAVKTALEDGIATAQSAIETAQSTADSALSTANTAKSVANGVKAQVDNTATGLAATKTIADDALAAANEANLKSVPMVGSTTTENGVAGLVPAPAMGAADRFLSSDGTWKKPQDLDTTYDLASATQNGLMSATDKALLDTAVAAGQLGDPVFIDANEVDANTILETGEYWVSLPPNSSLEAYTENHWPYTGFGTSTGYYLKVENNGSTAEQTLQHDRVVISRKINNLQNYSSWNNWFVKYCFFQSDANIYISKNGNDSNLGFSPDFPVLTVNRAIEIAYSITFNISNAQVFFRFGAGDWGDITFDSLPYTFTIAPYDGASPTEFSEDLPIFGIIQFYSCYAKVVGVNAQSVNSYDNSFVHIGFGYKSIGVLRLDNFGKIYLNNSSSATNVWEIQNIPSTAGRGIIYASNGSQIWMWRTRIKLSQNTSLPFIELNGDSSLFCSVSYTIFETTDFSSSGNKFKLESGTATITTNENPGVCTWLDKIPATGGIDLSPRLTINGLSTAAVNKSGDTMTGSLHIDGGTVHIHSNNYDASVSPQPSGSAYIFYGGIYDKNGTQLGRIFQEFASNKYRRLIFETKTTPDNPVGASFALVIKPDGTKVLGLPGDVPVDDNGNNAASTKWVNQKLGTAASLTALANIDEADENYIETLETKKLKAVAQINAEAQQAIYAGFLYEVDGAEYRIGYSLFDQNNLNADAIFAAQHPGELMSFRCMDEMGQTVWLDIPTENVLAVHRFGIVSHRNVIRKEADEKKARIMAATTETEIQAIIME